ncbi:MAG: NAD(P)-binding domain-containing protein [Candidatus Kariarchaeaceae archaeon]|jgi:glutamyl-tRNA reductase
MQNMPLSVITWRIGNSSIDSIESLLIKESQRGEVLQSLQKEFGSIFYMVTCQRIVLISSIDDKSRAIKLRDRFIEKSHSSKSGVDIGEMFVGSAALKHLAELISSLDSIVIGEDQIQYQFKQAYLQNEKYLDKTLKQILQQVIRIGKRIRSRTILGEGKTSMMSLIIQIYDDLIKNAESIAILGTGKMAQGVINTTLESNEKLSIYSRKQERIGIKINEFVTKDFSTLEKHDVIFTATTVEMPLITPDVIDKLGENSITIFDLGMPRNCSLEINELSNVTLIGIEDLLQLSHQVNLKKDFTNVYQVLQEEMESVLGAMIQRQKDPYYISLRSELSRIAAKYKTDFLKSDEQSEIKYQQLINRLIHVSQKHLQSALLESEVEN